MPGRIFRMSRFAPLAFLVLSLAACSKQEPPPTVATHPASAKPAAAANAVAPAASAPSAPAAVAEIAPAGNGGGAIFKKICATCHMADGSGVPYLQPSIKGSAWISNPDPQLLLSLILRGSTVLGEAAKAYDNDMPPLDNLSDAEVAAIATYVRSRFAAQPIADPVTPAQAAIARARPGLPE